MAPTTNNTNVQSCSCICVRTQMFYNQAYEVHPFNINPKLGSTLAASEQTTLLHILFPTKRRF